MGKYVAVVFVVAAFGQTFRTYYKYSHTTLGCTLWLVSDLSPKYMEPNGIAGLY